MYITDVRIENEQYIHLYYVYRM